MRCSKPLTHLVNPVLFSFQALSLEVVIDTVKQILHQEKVGSRQPGFEASLLQFFHQFLLRSPLNHITQAKSSFLALLKDGLQLNLPSPAVFLLLVNFHSYYQKVPGKENRRLRKDSQVIPRNGNEGEDRLECFRESFSNFHGNFCCDRFLCKLP